MLTRACEDAVIAFEIDELAADGSGGWSVNVVGIAALAGDSEHVRLLSRGLVTAAGDKRDQFVRIGSASSMASGSVRASRIAH